MAHLCGREHHNGTWAAASCPSSDWADFKRIYSLRWGNKGIFGSGLNHAWNYEELITRGVEQQSGVCVGLRSAIYTKLHTALHGNSQQRKLISHNINTCRFCIGPSNAIKTALIWQGMDKGPLRGPLAPGTRTLAQDLLGLVGLVSLIPGIAHPSDWDLERFKARSKMICGLEGPAVVMMDCVVMKGCVSSV